MKSNERPSSREPSHSPNLFRVVLIVFAAVLLLIGLAKLVAYTKLFGLR